MRLVIHGGLGKTASTWLQLVGLPLCGVHQTGKVTADDPEIHESMHYRLFTPIYKPSDMWRRNRNSMPLVRQYAETLGRDIQERSDVPGGIDSPKILVLSNETLLTYGGIEVNVPLVAALIQEVTKRVEGVDVDVVLTIREQKSFLRSYYAYDYANLKSRFGTFGDFLNHGVRDPDGEVFSMLHYDSVHSMLKASLGHCARVRFVPYELLRIGGANAFLSSFLDLPNVGGRADDAGSGDLRVNDQAGTGYHLRDQYRRSRLEQRIRGRLAEEPSWPGSGVARWLLSSSLIGRFIPRDPTRVLRRTATFEAGQEVALDMIYEASNARTSNLIGMDLGKLGYAVG